MTNTPHKGGRTDRLYARINPAVKAALLAYCQKHGITVADWIEQTVKQLKIDA